MQECTPASPIARRIHLPNIFMTTNPAVLTTTGLG